MISNRSLVTAAAVEFAAFAPFAQAQQDPGEWRQTVFLYGMGAAIEGDAQIGSVASLRSATRTAAAGTTSITT